MEKEIKILDVFDCDHPLKNIRSKKTKDALFDYVKKYTVLSTLDLEMKYVDKFVFDMYLYIVRLSKHLNEYLKYLNIYNIDTSIHLFLEKTFFTLKIKDITYDIIKQSISYDLLYNKIKLATYMFFNHLLTDDFCIKTTSSSITETIFLSNALLILTERFNRFDVTTKKCIFAHDIPVIEFESIIELSENDIRIAIETFKSNKSINRIECKNKENLIHNFYRRYEDNNHLKINVVDFKELFDDKNRAFIDEHLVGIVETINENPTIVNKIILPILNFRNTKSVIDFLNGILPDIKLDIYFRGIQNIQELFEVKETIRDFLIYPDQMINSNLVIDTDELSYHINQIKKSHHINDIIIDSDALIEDIYENNPYVETQMNLFKKSYLHIFKEIHAHLMYLKVPHSIYSAQLKNEAMLRMYKSSGFKNFILYKY